MILKGGPWRKTREEEAEKRRKKKNTQEMPTQKRTTVECVQTLAHPQEVKKRFCFFCTLMSDHWSGG